MRTLILTILLSQILMFAHGQTKSSHDTYESLIKKGDALLKPFGEDTDNLKAINLFSKAILINSQRYEAYYYRAYARRQLKNYDDAIRDLNIAIDLNPDLYYLYEERAICKSEIGHRNCIGFYVDNNGTYEKNGRCKAGDASYTSAIADLEYAIKICTNNKNSNLLFGFYIDEGNLYKDLNDKYIAKIFYEKVINEAEKDDWWYVHKAISKLAEIYSHDKYEDALLYFKKALNLSLAKGMDSQIIENDYRDLFNQYNSFISAIKFYNYKTNNSADMLKIEACEFLKTAENKYYTIKSLHYNFCD